MPNQVRSVSKSLRLSKLSALFRFFIYSNFYIAAIAILMAWQTSWIFLEGLVSHVLLFFIGFSTLCSYSFHYYLTDHSVLPSPRVKWTLANRNWVGLLLFTGLLGACWFGWILKEHWIWLISAAAATFLYSAPKIPHKYFRVLRKVAIGKTIFLAFIWIYVTAVLPIVVYGIEWTNTMRIYCMNQFFFVYAICILFDIRDREDDKADGVRSLITYLREDNIKRLYYFSLGIAMAGQGVMLIKGIPLGSIAILLIPVLVLFFIYDKAVRDLSDSFYYIFLDGLMALSAILMALIRI